jgi:hypothetical protein
MVLPAGIDSQLAGSISNVTASLYEGLTADHEDCEAPLVLRRCLTLNSPLLVRLDGQCRDT